MPRTTDTSVATTGTDEVKQPVFELRHRSGCPESYGGRFTLEGADPDQQPRKAIGVEAYVVTGTGRYNKITGEYERIPKTGVVRCLECAEQVLVEPADVPTIQLMLAELSRQKPVARQEA